MPQEEPDAQPDDGAFIHGMFIEGARWDRDSGEIRESFLRDLTPQMPVIHLVAIEASSVNESGYHDTPCYYVSQRGGGPPPIRKKKERQKSVGKTSEMAQNRRKT